MFLSFWEREMYFSNIDVVIIGSGIVGLNAAISLKRKSHKLKIMILEKGMFPMGASSKNAGFACFGSVGEILDDLKTHSENQVFSLLEKRYLGLQQLRKNLGDKTIDYKNYGGFEVFSVEEEFEAAAAKMKSLNQQLFSIIGKKEVYKNADKKIKTFGLAQTKHLIENTAEGQIDTGKMMGALISRVQEMGIQILNNVEVNSIHDEEGNVKILCNNNQTIDCKKVIIATNGFAKKLLPNYPVLPARAQVLITKPIKNLQVKGSFHMENGFYYFRNIGERILLGGGRNLDFKTEETAKFGITKKIQSKLDELLKTIILPHTNYEVDMRWSGIMGMGPQKQSIIKAVSKNVFCAVRLGGMGVAIGTLIGEEVADLTQNSL